MSTAMDMRRKKFTFLVSVVKFVSAVALTKRSCNKSIVLSMMNNNGKNNVISLVFAVTHIIAVMLDNLVFQ